MVRGISRGSDTFLREDFSMKTWEKVALAVSAFVFISGAVGIGLGSHFPAVAMVGTYGGSFLLVGSVISVGIILLNYYQPVGFMRDVTKKFEEIEEPLSEKTRKEFAAITLQEIPAILKQRKIVSEKDKISFVKNYIQAQDIDRNQLTEVLERVDLKLSGATDKLTLLKTLLIKRAFVNLEMLKGDLSFFVLPDNPVVVRTLALALMRLCARERPADSTMILGLLTDEQASAALALEAFNLCKELEGTPGEFDVMDLRSIVEAVSERMKTDKEKEQLAEILKDYPKLQGFKGKGGEHDE